MMVKKKTVESEENKDNPHEELTENKENTDTAGSENIISQENSAEVGAEEKRAGTQDKDEEVPDKKIPDEKQLEEKLAEMQDRYLRLSAEFDNYRKRTLKEKIELSKYAGEEILMNLLPFMDDFERALKHIEPTTENIAIKEGIDLIYNKLSEFLKQQGLKEIESLNCSFNVDLHDAVATVPVTEEEKKGKIIEVVSKGYYLKDKILRHSKVVIGE